VAKIDLVRDVLDKQMLDRNEREMGRVDGLVIEVPENGQPRLVRLESGATVPFARVGKWLAGPVRKIERAFGPKRLTPLKIPWVKVVKLGRDVHLDVDADESTALAWEKWVDKVLIDRIPGAKGKG
jgi:hypothetical protein